MNRGNPNFVPPLIAQETALVDPSRHPFYRHAEARFLLAERGGKPVGRIAAIRDRSYEEFWKEPTGFFGFYETAEEGAAGEETTRALLEEARRTLQEWGLTRLIGPANPSSNYTFGLLVEGFDSPPRIMMPYNPPRYDALLKSAGLAPAKDLLAYLIERESDFSRIRRVASRIESRNEVKVRPANMKRFAEEVSIIRGIYNDAWGENWGFAPMSPEEFDLMAKEMKDLVDPDFVLIAEIGGKPVAFSLMLPDVFEALRHLNGRLFTPWALARLLFHTYVWPKIRGTRILILGVKKEYRHLGLGTVMYIREFDEGRRKGYTTGEASWILEDNRPMIQALEAMNATPYKRYRVYQGDV